MYLFVIANQCAHWCGNPYSLIKPYIIVQQHGAADCRVSLRPPRNDGGNYKLGGAKAPPVGYKFIQPGLRP